MAVRRLGLHPHRTRGATGLLVPVVSLDLTKANWWWRSAMDQASRAGCLATNSALSREYRAVGDRLWLWDNRHYHKNSQRDLEEIVRLKNLDNPAWVDGRLAALERRMGCRSNWSLANDGDPRGSAGVETGVTAETLSRLCKQGQLSEAVEALGVLVQSDCRVSRYLLYTVLKKCMLERDVVLGRLVHALAAKNGYELDTFLCNHILRMYASHGRLQEAMDVFSVVDEPDAFMWSSIISAHVKHGQDKQAIQLYHQMRRSSVKPDGHVFVAALQACARGADLNTGQQVHTDVLVSGVEPDLFICSCLVDMYAKCGSLGDARKVFDRLSHKNVVTWNAMIAGYSHHGTGQEALHVYRAMQEEGIVAPNPVTFACLLQACARLGVAGLEKGKQLHAQTREQGVQADVLVASSLISMYAKCGSLVDARAMFDELGQKHLVTWNAMIAGYSQQDMGQEALQVYSAMQEEGRATPDSATFVSLLQACATLGTQALEKGKQLHAQIREYRLQGDLFVASSLVNMYAKCGSLADAQSVFDALGLKTAAMWNAMIAGYAQHGMGREALCLYRRMQEEDIVAPDSVTFVCLLQACASVGTPALEQGKQFHAEIGERGLHADVFVANSLINMYAKCGSVEDAQSLFDGLSQKNVVTWNAMMAAYSQLGMGLEALHLHTAMQQEGIAHPDSVTFVCLLQACSSVGNLALEKGKQLHAQIIERGLQCDSLVANSLVNMYSKCGSLEAAQGVFDSLGQKNAGTWNAMITGYSQQGMGQEALHLHTAMQLGGVVGPDSVTLLCLLQACASVGAPALDKGKQFHAQIREQGLEADVFVASTLVNMYAKCGSLEDARQVFDRLGQKNVVTWSAMIAGYAQQGMGEEAIGLYKSMQEEGIVAPNSVTFVCLLQACANVAALQLGRLLHAQVKEQGLQVDVLVAHSLINMYGKCGSMVDAQEVFDGLPEQEDIAWNALMAGYTRQGDSEVVLTLFHKMRQVGLHASAITFLSVLAVCSHVGLVDEGREYFDAMRRHYGIAPSTQHYTCMVDLLGRAGQLDEAASLVWTMPVVPDAAVWHSLLGACRKWSNVELGRLAFHEAVKLDKKNAAAYVLMSNIFSGVQMWEQAREMQERRREIGAWKQRGQSLWTDMTGLVHIFSVGDTSKYYPKGCAMDI